MTHPSRPLLDPETVIPVVTTGHVLLLDAFDRVMDSAPVPTGRDCSDFMEEVLRRNVYTPSRNVPWRGHAALWGYRLSLEAVDDHDVPIAMFVEPGDWEVASVDPSPRRGALKVTIAPAAGNPNNEGFAFEVADPDLVKATAQGDGVYRWADRDALRWLQWIGFYPYSKLERP